MVMVESRIYPNPNADEKFIEIGRGITRQNEDAVCIRIESNGEEAHIYLSHEQSRKLSSLLTDWFMQKGKYSDD